MHLLEKDEFVHVLQGIAVGSTIQACGQKTDPSLKFVQSSLVGM